MEIVRGIQLKAQKVVIYGPEGIGKSTLASKFPEPLFIDTEGSTAYMNVDRTKKPTSWTMLLDLVREFISTDFKTLVIDTIDWAEQLCIEDLLARHQKSGIEDFGYGNGYVYEKEEFGRFLNMLQEIVDYGKNVVLVAHSQIRKFEQPDEMGAYDRYELKLGKKTSSQISPLVKEWADAVLFCNYKTYSVSVDDTGKKHKGQGGKRVIYTSHHPCWDAKNRWGLPEECDFDYSVIAPFIEMPGTDASGEVKTEVNVNTAEPQHVPQASETHEKLGEANQEVTVSEETAHKITVPEVTVPETAVPKKPDAPDDYQRNESPPAENPVKDRKNIPKALSDLMDAAPFKVTIEDIQDAVSSRGYYPKGTPISNYDSAFIDGCLIAAWNKVLDMIHERKIAKGEFLEAQNGNLEEIPFDI